jgi:MtrB/PioB family decaheme-associated outer membrane protein
MKRRVKLLLTCSTGALIIAAAGSIAARAADMPVKAPVITAEEWWYHGAVEVGGRGFLNDPVRGGLTSQGQGSLAKYYEYSDVRPGPFANIDISAGTTNGLYLIDFWARNIGYEDQSYHIDASKAGEHYVDFVWDQTPHLYSTSAMTPYLGVGTTTLTLPAGARSNTATTSAFLAPFMQQTDIGIRRDTGAVNYRWTPNDSWDVRADYSHMTRSGTQVDGVTGLVPSSAFGATTQVPRPVSDTTQNFGVNGEYAGTSFWGQRLTFKAFYKGSLYDDDFSSYTIQNPYCTGSTSATCETTTLSPVARLSLPPSNQANAVGGTLAADLPWNSRYVGTLNYTMMRQNDPFMPMTSNPSALPAAQALPATSLNGAINTLLSNNVLTSKITPELTSKLSFRFYDYQNDTPEILFTPTCGTATTCWVSYDHLTAGGLGTERAIQSLSMAYTKTNFGEELVWRPTHQWNLGAAYGFERFDYTRADVNVTNENSFKLFGDWKPLSNITVRSSAYYADRQLDNYNYLGFVGNAQFPNPAATSWIYQSSYRQLMLDNRYRSRANFSVDYDIAPGLTITPNARYQDDRYGVNSVAEQGLQDSTSWNAGVDVTYVVNPQATVMFGYLREQYHQTLYGTSCTGVTAALGNMNCVGSPTQTTDSTAVDTFTTMARVAAIPQKLDLEMRYTISHAVDKTKLLATPDLGATQFPDNMTLFQRLDATAIYTLDPDFVNRLGWKGLVKAKLHYVYERNAENNWQQDPVAPFSPAISAASVWTGYFNPNYNVHLLAGSLVASW